MSWKKHFLRATACALVIAAGWTLLYATLGVTTLAAVLAAVIAGVASMVIL